MKLIFNEQVENGINIVLYDCSKDSHISTEILKKNGSGPTINRSDWKFIYRDIISEYLLIPVDTIKRSIHNKPYLEGRKEKVSISHTGNLLAIIISESKKVGVDIEILGDRISKIAHKFIHADEMKSIEENHKITQQLILWCAKESMYKLFEKRELSFKENIRLLPYSFSSNQNSLSAWVKKADEEVYAKGGYRIINDIVLVYFLEC
jgi:phosphopantetheinyl transferase